MLISAEKIAEMRGEIAKEDASDGKILIEWSSQTVTQLLDHIDTLTAQLATAKADAERVREALEHIREYWNGSETDGAMSDALHHIDEVAAAAFEIGKGEG